MRIKLTPLDLDGVCSAERFRGEQNGIPARLRARNLGQDPIPPRPPPRFAPKETIRRSWRSSDHQPRIITTVFSTIVLFLAPGLHH